MRNAVLLALCLFALSSGGCIMQSIHPIYTDETIVTDDAFLGTWNAPKDDVDPLKSIIVEGRDDKSYLITLTLEPKEAQPATIRLDARLVELDDHRFIDLSIAHDADDPCLGKYAGFVVPTHTFFRVALTKDSLTFAGLSNFWFREHLKSSPNAVQHTTMGENEILLTASTPELQSFLKMAAKDDKAFRDGEPLTKAPPAP